MLVVKCKLCERSYNAPIQMDRQSFQSAIMRSNTYQCPHCGQKSTYEKAEYKIID